MQDGDARESPFPDNSLDVVLSRWALHNIQDRAGRGAAIREIARVLQPGGRIGIIDIRHTREYAQALEEARMPDIRRSGPDFMLIIPSFALGAGKPAAQGCPPSLKIQSAAAARSLTITAAASVAPRACSTSLP